MSQVPKVIGLVSSKTAFGFLTEISKSVSDAIPAVACCGRGYGGAAGNGNGESKMVAYSAISRQRRISLAN